MRHVVFNAACWQDNRSAQKLVRVLGIIPTRFSEALTCILGMLNLFYTRHTWLYTCWFPNHTVLPLPIKLGNGNLTIQEQSLPNSEGHRLKV
jgi:hypothetical protein